MQATPIVLAIVMVLALLRPASAEFYRYVDKHGNVLYTDDLSKVPADQREQARSYDESFSEPAKPAESSPPKAPAPQDPVTAQASEGERRQLEEQEKILNREYEALMKQRASLDEEKAKAVTPAQIKEYNQKIVDFNTRIKAYEVKQDTYSEKVKAFNERSKSKPSEAQQQ